MSRCHQPHAGWAKHARIRSGATSVQKRSTLYGFRRSRVRTRGWPPDLPQGLRESGGVHGQRGTTPGRRTRGGPGRITRDSFPHRHAREGRLTLRDAGASILGGHGGARRTSPPCASAQAILPGRSAVAVDRMSPTLSVGGLEERLQRRPHDPFVYRSSDMFEKISVAIAQGLCGRIGLLCVFSSGARLLFPPSAPGASPRSVGARLPPHRSFGLSLGCPSRSQTCRRSRPDVISRCASRRTTTNT